MTEQTIYLCDDDAGVRGALSFLLKQHSFTVVAHASGPDLLACIDHNPKELRGVFVLDVRMEPMSGPVLHEQLLQRGLGKTHPVIFLSGHGDIPVAVAAMAKGALNFVEKPYTDDMLLPMLREALVLEDQWHRAAVRRDFLLSMWESLAPQQRRIARLKSAGDLNKVIAAQMHIAERTVEEHWVKVRDKLGVDSAATLATTMAEMRASGIDTAGDTE
jgi:two-component system response regulator DctR